MKQEWVSMRRDQGVAWVTIEREDKLNAFNRDVFSGLESAFESAAEDDAIRAVVLGGAGDRAFVAGADIGELREVGTDGIRDFASRGHDLMARIEGLGKPVIAAINGFALGGGCELALACTLRIASDQALLGLPEVKLGLIPGYGGTQRLARLVGSGRALHMMLTGEPVNAGQALDMGLVNQVVAHAELRKTVEKLAIRLARSAPVAMRGIIEAVNRGADLPLAEGLSIETEQFSAAYATEDMLEGTSAFLEKRRAEFKGR